MQFVYNTRGTCSQQIIIDIDDNKKLANVTYIGGCNGNLKGISSLVKGMNIDDVITKLEGTTCGFKPTSCPDQLTNLAGCCCSVAQPHLPSVSSVYSKP